MGETSAISTQNEFDSSSRERGASDSAAELKNDIDDKKMNGKLKPQNSDGETRRRTFGTTLGKRLRLILRPWKWRRKNKRNRYLGTSQRSFSGKCFRSSNHKAIYFFEIQYVYPIEKTFKV